MEGCRGSSEMTASRPDPVMCGYVKLPGGCVITKLVFFALLGIFIPTPVGRSARRGLKK